mmetsp:Transcript_48705/g.128827  ORF Transcript_48705/g.128827 Transcript_48705/m.128827 type:complete len:123 (+) Transcript_48705:600-968(+)
MSIIDADGKKISVVGALDAPLTTLSLTTEDSSGDMEIGLKFIQVVEVVDSAAEVLKIPGFTGLSKKKGWKAKADKEFKKNCLRVEYCVDGDDADVKNAIFVESDATARDKLLFAFKVLKSFK